MVVTFKFESTLRKDIFAENIFKNLELYRHSKSRKNEENDEEKTDNEDFVRTSSNSNDFDDVIV